MKTTSAFISNLSPQRIAPLIGSFALVVLALLAPRPALAIGGSEDEIFQADINEARARAKDFNSQKLREANEDLQRQLGTKEVKRDRAQFEAQQEKERESYVQDRNERPNVWREQARLERQFDEEKIVEDKQMDKNRRDYKKKRERVRRLIHSEARIDENQEYGL